MANELQLDQLIPLGSDDIANESTVPGATVTDALQDIAVGAGLSQVQQLYQGLAGNDSNDGTSIDDPKLTVASMVTAAGTPTAANPFLLKMIGGQVNSESFTVPPFTTLEALETIFKGEIILSQESRVVAKGAETQDNQDSFTSASGFNCYVDLETLGDGGGGTNKRGLILTGTTTMHANIKIIKYVSAGAQAWNLTNSLLYINCQRVQSTLTPGVDGGSGVFPLVLDYLSPRETLISNVNGVRLEAGGDGDSVFRPDGISLGNADRFSTLKGSGSVITGSSLVVEANFSPAPGVYILNYTETFNSTFRNLTLFSVSSNINFTLDKLVGTVSTDWGAITNGANIQLVIANNSGFTLSLKWNILRVVS